MNQIIEQIKTIENLIESDPQNFINLNWNKSLLNYRETAIKRERISTPSYYQVIQPIYKHANQRWKRYKKHLTNIEPNLSELIKKYQYLNK